MDLGGPENPQPGLYRNQRMAVLLEQMPEESRGSVQTHKGPLKKTEAWLTSTEKRTFVEK